MKPAWHSIKVFWLLLILLLNLFVTSCAKYIPTFRNGTPSQFQIPLTPTSTPAPEPSITLSGSSLYAGTEGYPWWNDAVFYEIFVRSFYDSNGDGIGDFNGIIAKLDYLNDGNPETTSDLGVTGIWLMPIFPSPSYHGYDVTDYGSVNPQYGTMDDFKRLLSEAHKRGIRVIIDLVINHTSSHHPWFEQAKNDPNSTYRDWYIWSETDPGYLGPWGERVWHSSPTGFYYGIFVADMPDLNYKNPAVTQQMNEVVSFWLQDVGVDGFRLDAAKHLIENGAMQENTAGTHEWYKAFRSSYKNDNPQAMTVGELFGDNLPTLASYSHGDQFDLTFNFDLASGFLNSVLNGESISAVSQLKYSTKLLPPLQYATFLTNHDQDRLMSRLGNDPNKVKVAASLLLTSPGVPFLYYGEELGLEGVGQDPLKRRPMQWNAETNGGFSTHSPWESIGPDAQKYNVISEKNDSNSILTHYQNLIHLRNQHAALRAGEILFVGSGNQGLYAIMRITKSEAVMVLVNLTGAPINNYTLSLTKSDFPGGTYQLLPILGNGDFGNLVVSATGSISDYQPAITVPAYGTTILLLTPGQSQ
jgi:alpha-amylase